MGRPKRLHLVSWFTQKVLRHFFEGFPSHSLATLLTLYALYISRSLCILDIWSSPCLFESNCTRVGWSLACIFGAHYAIVGLRIVRWILEIHCTRGWSLPCIFGAHLTRGCAREKTRSSRRLLCRPSGHGQTGGAQRGRNKVKTAWENKK